MTYKCPKCNKTYSTEYEMLRCNCQSSQKCPDCNGTGKKVEMFGPSIPCPRCHGSGKLYY